MKVPPEQLPYVPFDLVARSFLVARKSWEIETALSFYRKGRADVNEQRYIEAIYDFYFMLESVFAEGKFKSAQVEEKFGTNERLLAHISRCLNDPILISNMSRDQRILSAFRANYMNKKSSEVVAHIVKLRGFLHHHSGSRQDIWHPEEHIRFGADAFFLQHLCYEVAFEMTEPLIFSKDTVDSYAQLVKTAVQKTV